MSDGATLVRDTRQRAGLTQAQLASRMGTTQSAIARLEAKGANPRLSTLMDAMEACGSRLQLLRVDPPAGVDETLVARRLRMTPSERLRTLRAMGEFADRVRPG